MTAAAPIPGELPHESTLPVLGVPVRLRSNARDVIDAFETALGRWRVMERHPERLPFGAGGLWLGERELTCHGSRSERQNA